MDTSSKHSSMAFEVASRRFTSQTFSNLVSFKLDEENYLSRKQQTLITICRVISQKIKFQRSSTRSKKKLMVVWLKNTLSRSNKTSCLCLDVTENIS